MILEILFTLIKTLLFTCIIEGIAILLIERKFIYVKYNSICNFVTNPILNIVILLLVNLISIRYYYAFVLVGEMIVIATETWLYGLMTNLSFNRRVVISVVTNFISYFLGMLL